MYTHIHTYKPELLLLSVESLRPAATREYEYANIKLAAAAAASTLTCVCECAFVCARVCVCMSTQTLHFTTTVFAVASWS